MQSINTNLYSLNAQQSYGRSSVDLATSLQRLSSGLRINSARDDAAGLAIASRMDARIAGLDRAGKNANDGISLLQVADGAVGTIVDNFQRLRQLAVQAANASNTDTDRAALQTEASALVSTNYQIANNTAFNQIKLLDGSFNQQFQIGANGDDTLRLSIPSVFAQASDSATLVDAPVLQVNAVGQVSAALSAGDLTINGKAVGASAAGGGAGQGSASAFAVAAAINAANVPGVTATAANSLQGNAGAGGGNIAGGVLTVNGVALGAISGANGSALAASAAAAFTSAAGSSGVTATSSGSTLTLTAADGRDITISQSVGGSAAQLGLSAGVHQGTVTISNAAGASPPPLIIGGAHPGNIGLSAGAQAATPTGATTRVFQSNGAGSEPAIDLTTFQGATDAITYLDGKIDSADNIRSLLGASQNRLAMVYSDLQDSGRNLTEARSRIMDTDYASETAQLTRAQILQKAAAAIITQANALPNTALILLR